MVVQELAVGAVVDDATLAAEAGVLLAAEAGESPLLGDHYLLLAGELERGPAYGFDHVHGDGVLAADGEDDLPNLHAGDCAIGLAECTTHSGLESVVGWVSEE